MRESDAILESYDESVKNGLRTILATVVHVKGSSYRAAGARMLVDEYGYMTGAISGGCLEGDALRKALLALEQNRNKLVTYDTSDEDDAVIGAQLGCNGIIQVLFEPVDPANDLNPVELLRRANNKNKTYALASIFNLNKREHQQGTSLLIDETGSITSETNDESLSEAIYDVAVSTIKKRVNHFGEYVSKSGTQHAFIDVIPPPHSLVLVGAGNDSQVLSEMARHLGWSVTVADGRPSHANEKRFSNCQVVVANPESILDDIEINESTAVVLMTHNYNYDLAVLKLLLDFNELTYIGILGPNKKHRRMFRDLRNEGIILNEKHHAKIYAPVGLQVGAETPAEIGLSILSEIQAVLTGSDVKHLREIDGSIHQKDQYQFEKVQL
ncbi:XdhC family protein [Rhodohalobacter sp. 8-1]|uniref:XdhC family protein n=1 Tax=Rhodohalobacter sp. 8-1 TaxID=3131972 RepID=UPI0030EF802F